MNGPNDSGAWALLLGAALFAAAASVQGMMVAFHLADRLAKPPASPDLAQFGRLTYLPEHDTPVYLLGDVVGVAFAALLARWLMARTRARVADPDARAGIMLGEAGRLAILGAIVAALGLVGLAAHRILDHGGPLGFVAAALLVGPPVLALGGIAFWPIASAGGLAHRLGLILASALVGPSPAGEPGSGSRARGWLFSLAVAAFLAAVILVPDWRRLASTGVFDISPFHHWDVFVLGPTLGYLHGNALCTTVYSQYGVGWPMLLTWLAPIAPPSHGLLFLYATVVGYLYLFTLYLALRWVTGRPVWAAVGTILATNLTVFLGYPTDSTIWAYPSSTCLRSPTDLAVLVALWRHARTGKTLWAALAGVAVGVGLIVVTDRGIYLGLTLAVYFACRLAARRLDPSTPTGPGLVRSGAVAALGVAVPVIAGLALASRGTLLQPEFWRGWLEAPRIYVGGMGSLPVSESGLKAAVVFIPLLTINLIAVALVGAAILARKATPTLAALGALGAYGLLILLLFVNRSHHANLFHVALPPCAILTVAASRFRAGLPRRAASLVPWVALVGVLLLLVANPKFRRYPSVLHDALRGPLPSGGWLASAENVRGLDPSSPVIDDLAQVSATIIKLRAEGRSVEVLDGADTMYYLVSGCPPMDRYCPSPSCFIWKDQIKLRIARLRAQAPDFVLMRGPDAWRDELWGDALDEIHQVVTQEYDPTGDRGRFTLWRRRGAAPPAKS